MLEGQCICYLCFWWAESDVLSQPSSKYWEKVESSSIQYSIITSEWNIFTIGTLHKVSTIQTPSHASYSLNSYFSGSLHSRCRYLFYIDPWWFVILSFSVYLANPFTSISKIASIAPRTDSMRLAAGWGSPFPLQRGLQTQSLDILKVAWFPCLLFQTLPPPTSRMSARSPYSGPHRKLVLAFDVGTTFSGISYWSV